MQTRIHHAAVRTNDLEGYTEFFQRVFEMKIAKTAGEKPNRQLWFFEGVQLIETPDTDGLAAVGLCDHIALGVDKDPAAVAKLAIENGCSPVEDKDARWFALPNGVRVEMMPY